MTATLWLTLTPLRTFAPTAVAAAIVVGLATALRAVRPLAGGRAHHEDHLHGRIRRLVGAALLLPLHEAVLVGAVFGLGRTAPVAPLGASHRLATWWGDVVYGGETTLALRASAMLSAGFAVLAVSRVIAL